VLKKKIWANFQRIIELFTQKIVTKLSKIWPEKTYSGSRIQGSKRHRIPDQDPQHWEFGSLPGGSHDDGVGSLVRLLNARHLGLALDPDEEGDKEGRRLSGPCLRHSDDVPVGQAYSIRKFFFMTARGNLDRIYPLSTVVSLLPSRPLSCCLFAVFSAEVFRI
jgi:hypothetical protein